MFFVLFKPKTYEAHIRRPLVNILKRKKKVYFLEKLVLVFIAK